MTFGYNLFLYPKERGDVHAKESFQGDGLSRLHLFHPALLLRCTQSLISQEPQSSCRIVHFCKMKVGAQQLPTLIRMINE